MELKLIPRKLISKDQLRNSAKNKVTLKPRTNRHKKTSRRNVLSLSRESQGLKLSLKLRKITRCKHKLQNMQDVRTVIRSLISSKKRSKAATSPVSNSNRDERKRVLSAGRFELEHSEKQREMNFSMVELHQKMIHRINRKLEQTKIVNGRFCSPVMLRQKATDFQSLNNSSKSISQESNGGSSKLPQIRKMTPEEFSI